jgi:phage gp29-like protein
MAKDKPGLVDQYGQPIQRALLSVEVAGPTITGVRSPIAGYPGDGLNPGRLAALLREADLGEPMRYLELAEQIEERDLHYVGVLGTRKRSVAQLEITVEAASDAKVDVDRADMVREWLKRDELQDEIFDILDAIGKGFSQTEIIWDSSMGQWRPGRLEWRDPRWFRFKREDGKTPLLRSDNGDQPLPAFKFISAVMRAKSGLPIRSGIARLATWSWMFKAFTQRDWAIFTQTYGQPIRVGKYGPGATEADKDTLFRAVANIAGDCAAIIPEGMAIEFIESKSAASNSDLYLKRADWLDQQISKAVLGQTATTDAVTGGLGSGKEHRQVQEDIERADAKSLSAILNRDLIRPWIDLEYGPQKLYPRLRIGRAEDRDITQLVDSIDKLVPMGLRVGKSWINDQLGIPDPGKTEDVLTAPAAAPAIGSAPALQSTQRNAGQDEVDMLASAAENIAQGGTDAMIDYIRGLVDGAPSLQAVQESLLKARPNMPQAQLTRLMQVAMAMAELSGRADIADQA